MVVQKLQKLISEKLQVLVTGKVTPGKRRDTFWPRAETQVTLREFFLGNFCNCANIVRAVFTFFVTFGHLFGNLINFLKHGSSRGSAFLALVILPIL